MKQYLLEILFKQISVSMMGAFSPTEACNRYILVACIISRTGQRCMHFLLVNFFFHFGFLQEIHSDQRNFESSVFREMCRVMDIRKTRTTPLHPQLDGMVERFNKMIEKNLIIMVNEHLNDWNRHLPIFLMAYQDDQNYLGCQQIWSLDARRTALHYISQLEDQIEDIHCQTRKKMKIERRQDMTLGLG